MCKCLMSMVIEMRCGGGCNHLRMCVARGRCWLSSILLYVSASFFSAGSLTEHGARQTNQFTPGSLLSLPLYTHLLAALHS